MLRRLLSIVMDLLRGHRRRCPAVVPARVKRQAVVALLALGAFSGTANAQFGPAPVVVNKVLQRSVAPVQTFVATVMPLRKSVVGTAVDGRVEKFLFDEANPETKLTVVNKGQPLANLREGTVRILYEAAQANRDLRQAEYDEAVETYEDNVRLADAEKSAAAAQLQYAKATFDRTRQLYEQNRSVSLEQYDQVRAAYTQAQQNYVASELRLKLAQRQDRIAQAKARLDQAGAELRQMEDRIDKYTIRAPFDGFVVEEHTEVGAWIREGDPVAVVVQLDPVEVRAFVPEKFIGRLQIGSKAVIRPNVPLPANEIEPVGHVTGIVAEAVARSRTFPIKIQVENSNFRLKAGMLAEVELEIGDRKPSLLVPKDALNLDGATPRIFIAQADPDDPKKVTARMVAVEKGASIGRWIAVTPLDGSLQLNDLVVEKGNERLRPGAPLIPLTEGATPPPAEPRG